MDLIFLGNIVSLFGASLMVAVGFIQRRRHILIAQSLQFAIMSVSNFLLGGISGVISNTLGFLRSLFCLKYTLSFPLAAAFVAVQALITFGLNSAGWIGWLPVAAAIALNFVINTKNEILLKAAIIFGQLCWLVYDLSLSNYVSSFFDVFAVLSNIWGIVSLVLAARKSAAGSAQ